MQWLNRRVISWSVYFFMSPVAWLSGMLEKWVMLSPTFQQPEMRCLQDLFKQLLEGLDHIHKKMVVHREPGSCWSYASHAVIQKAQNILKIHNSCDMTRDDVTRVPCGVSLGGVRNTPSAAGHQAGESPPGPLQLRKDRRLRGCCRWDLTDAPSFSTKISQLLPA